MTSARGRGRPRLAEGDETEKITVYVRRSLAAALRARGKPGAVLRELAEREFGGLAADDTLRDDG